MQRDVLALVIPLILLCSSLFCVSPSLATPLSESKVDAIITCSFTTGAQLSVQAQMIVHRIDNIYDKSYDRVTIESISSTDLEVMGIIKQRLRDSLKDQLETSFPYAQVGAVNRPSYVLPYFFDTFEVNLTPAFFQYDGALNLTNVITGFLDMGATITYRFDLQAEGGWNTTFKYALLSTMRLAYANTADSNPDANTVTWMVRNWAGTDAGTNAILSVQSEDPTTDPSETDDIVLEFMIDTRSLNNISFFDSILVKKVDIASYGVLPEFITGVGSLPADGLRLCIANDLLTWNDVFEKTILPIEQETTALIENSSLKQSLQFLFSWDADSTTNCSTPYNVTQMDDTPAVKANFIDSDVHLSICQIPARAFFGLINAGATAAISSVDVNFGVGLEGVMYPYVIMLQLPNNISLDGKNVYTWNSSTPLMGAFSSDLQPMPPYTAEQIETRVEIELEKMDLNILSTLTGKTELTTAMKLKEDTRLYVIQRSDAFSFSPKINITYLNADAFRLCVQENVCSQDNIDVFLIQRRDVSQQRLSQIIPGVEITGEIDRSVFLNSLEWDGDISAMDAVVPVVVSNYANEVYPVGFNMSVWPAELSLAPQHFTLQGLENQTVSYRIIFPRGITVNASEGTGKPLVTGSTNDGRNYVEVSVDGSSLAGADLICVLNASPVYVLGLFLPCILVFILLLVLVVIIFLIRKKKGGLRRGKRKLFEPEDTEPSEYSEQEYYVPPPPSSTRRKK